MSRTPADQKDRRDQTAVRSLLDRVARDWVIVPLMVLAAYLIVTLSGSPYYAQLVLNIAIYATFALSLYMIIGLLGEVSFGHGLYLGLGAYLLAIFSTRVTDVVAVSLVLTVLGCAAFAGVTGLVASLLHKVPFAMLTFALNGLLFVVAQNATNLTQGEIGLSVPRPDLLSGEALVFAAVVLYLAAFAGVAWLRSSALGFILVAIRDNEDLAQSLGIRPWPLRLLILTLAGTLGGISGIMFGMNITVVTPSSLAMYYTTVGLVIVVVGGRGGPAGGLLGAAFFVAVPEFLRTTNAALQIMVFAFMLILTVRYLPGGLLGIFDRLRSRAGRQGELHIHE